MPVYTTYEQVGIREDISNVITNIDPVNTPFLSMVKDEKVHNTYYQWQEDHLTAVGLNAQPDGFTATDTTLSPTIMRHNGTQILSKTVRVSGSADAVQTYGRAKELAYQLAKAGVEIKRELEFSLVGNAQTYNAGNDSTPGAGTPRVFGSFQAMCDGPNFGGVDPGFETVFYADTGTFTAPTSAPALTGLSEDMVLSVDQRLYNNGSEATILMVKPNDATKIAAFAFRAPASAGNPTGRQRYMVGDSTTIVNVVDVYKSPYGEKKVIMNRFSRMTDAFMFDPKYWAKAVLRGWARETLAKTGDNTAVMLVGEFGLKHKNYRASGFITDLA